MSEKVGLVGGGIMGRLMVEKMVAQGYEVFVSDPSPAAQEICKKAGAQIVPGNEELASVCEKILVSLPSPKICLAVAKQLAGCVKKGQIIMETSTNTPENSIEISHQYDGTGAIFLEASILGKPVSVGKWVMPVGGDEAAVKEMEPILLTFAQRVERVGAVGSSSTLKLLNNTMYAVINACICEVMAVADNAGVDKKKFYDIVANSNAATNCGLFKETGYRIAIDKYDDPSVTNAVVRKDNACGVELAKSVGITPVIANLVLSIYDNAVSCGYADEDDSVLYKYFRQIYASK